MKNILIIILITLSVNIYSQSVRNPTDISFDEISYSHITYGINFIKFNNIKFNESKYDKLKVILIKADKLNDYRIKNKIKSVEDKLIDSIKYELHNYNYYLKFKYSYRRNTPYLNIFFSVDSYSFGTICTGSTNKFIDIMTTDMDSAIDELVAYRIKCKQEKRKKDAENSKIDDFLDGI